MSQGLAAGVPQLIMHMAHDQPDNADRLQRLGAGIGLTVGQFTPDRVTKELRRFLSQDSFREAAAKCAVRIATAPKPDELMPWIDERLQRA
jgi:rhamnosyltransferase subunit B